MLKPFVSTFLSASLVLLLGLGFNCMPVVEAHPLKTMGLVTTKPVSIKPIIPAMGVSPLTMGLYESFQLPHQQQLESVFQNATNALEKAKTRTESIGWVVLDLDETVLDNRAYFIANGNYKPELWKQWLLLGNAPAIAGSLKFVDFLKANQIPFAFLSGRREAQRIATLQNLMRLGLPTTVPVLMKPDTYTEGKTAVEFKQAHRCGLEAQSGVKVWLLIGDQASDLRGECKGNYQFKLPNPIYTVE
jgi:HAD superfamily, subfamily IIIB (Acid phosphatase)